MGLNIGPNLFHRGPWRWQTGYYLSGYVTPTFLIGKHADSNSSWDTLQTASEPEAGQTRQSPSCNVL